MRKPKSPRAGGARGTDGGRLRRHLPGRGSGGRSGGPEIRRCAAHRRCRGGRHARPPGFAKCPEQGGFSSRSSPDVRREAGALGTIGGPSNGPSPGPGRSFVAGAEFKCHGNGRTSWTPSPGRTSPSSRRIWTPALVALVDGFALGGGNDPAMTRITGSSPRTPSSDSPEVKLGRPGIRGHAAPSPPHRTIDGGAGLRSGEPVDGSTSVALGGPTNSSRPPPPFRERSPSPANSQAADVP